MEIHTLVLGAYATNTYVIFENGEGAVIDPAADAVDIIDFAAQKQIKITSILITHAHFDHIGGASELAKAAGAKVYISPIDHKLIKAGDRNSVFCCMTDIFAADVEVHDGDEFNIIGHNIKVIETPGHTPGSVCYILDDGIIFSGDTLFNLSIGRTDFEYGDRCALQRSLKKLFSMPHDYKVLPGHGSGTTLEFERNHNPYAKD